MATAVSRTRSPNAAPRQVEAEEDDVAGAEAGVGVVVAVAEPRHGHGEVADDRGPLVSRCAWARRPR